jgi:hypothetical protein
MWRRRFLSALTTGVAGGVAGCLEFSPGDDEARTTTAETVVRSSVDGVSLPVPESAFQQPLPRDYIPAIVDPAFASDWRGLESTERSTRLPDDAPVIGVERDGRARAYPLRVLDRHEVVNDEFDGPIAVTFCVLCGSGVVLERRVAGERTRFGVSGKLWRSNLVMYDQLTESLWSQLMATALRGPRTGERLSVLPSALTTWGAWRAQRPETRVLLPPPHSDVIAEWPRSFDYFSSRYDYGDESQLIGLDSHDGGLYQKTMVVGVAAGDVVRAYPFPVVVDAGVVNDRVGDRSIVVATTPNGTLVAYDRRVDGTVLRFEADGDRYLAGGGSRWDRASGRAVDGALDGRRLERANEHPPMFWLGWSKFNPETEVYGRDTES